MQGMEYINAIQRTVLLIANVYRNIADMERLLHDDLHRRRHLWGNGNNIQEAESGL